VTAGGASGAAGGGKGAPITRRALPWVAVLAGLVLIVWFGGRRPDQGVPLDPASPGPLGTKALVEVLGAVGARVEVTGELPAGGAGGTTALLLGDDLDAGRRDRLRGWVRAGGTLVVADPGSPVTGLEPLGGTAVGPLAAELERRCGLPALRDAARVAAPGGVVFEVPAGSVGCYPRGKGSWLVAQPLGAGTVVRLGGASALVNQQLGKADNAVLAASLLAPAAGTRVTVLAPPPPGGGSRGLADLVAPRVKLAMVQLLVAFVVLALWRARRLGRPVVEPQPVQLPGSELVVAVGTLLQRARGRGQAAGLLADDLRRTLAERLGLPASAPPEQVADAAAARTGVPRERVLAALTAAPRDEAGLVALAHAVDRVRREVTSAS
jgi:Domain of unknown function (DUF4350)